MGLEHVAGHGPGGPLTLGKLRPVGLGQLLPVKPPGGLGGPRAAEVVGELVGQRQRRPVTGIRRCVALPTGPGRADGQDQLAVALAALMVGQPSPPCAWSPLEPSRVAARAGVGQWRVEVERAQQPGGRQA
jgi:hypothetical protein